MRQVVREPQNKDLKTEQLAAGIGHHSAVLFPSATLSQWQYSAECNRRIRIAGRKGRPLHLSCCEPDCFRKCGPAFGRIDYAKEGETMLLIILLIILIFGFGYGGYRVGPGWGYYGGGGLSLILTIVLILLLLRVI